MAIVCRQREFYTATVSLHLKNSPGQNGMFRLLDFAIAAYRYFPIANEAEDLDIDQRLIKNFITIYKKDNKIARAAVNGPTMRRIQEWIYDNDLCIIYNSAPSGRNRE